MHSDHVFVFDIWGEYGHFRKFNTTTSPLTYSIPSRPTLIGMIGAILGIERELTIGKYAEGQIPLSSLLSPALVNIAVQVLKPIQKVQMGFNLLNTKTSFFNIENRTQIEFELLKSPAYRIFFQSKDLGLMRDLIKRVEDKNTHFTVNLGLSQFVADISAIGQFKVNEGMKDEFVPVISALKMSLLDAANPIYPENEFRYTADTFPIWMTPDRLVQEYAEILVEATGKAILAKSKHIIEVESFGNILFL